MTRTHPTAQTASLKSALKDARAGSGVHPLAPVGRKADNLGKLQREGTRAAWQHHLESGTSKAGDTYSRRTVEGYVEAVALFGTYLDRIGFAGDYTDVTVEEINGFLTGYRKTHSVGGANTKQRRLRTFYAWVELVY